MQLKKNWLIVLLALALCLPIMACGGEEEESGDNGGKNTASALQYCEGGAFKYGLIVIQKSDGTQIEVCINNLPVRSVKGGVKVEGTTWDIVDRQGVMLSDILDKAGIAEDDSYPVNLIGGDGFDALRTKIQDTGKLPKLDFMRAYAYIYADDPGNKHPHYPAIGDDALLVDYNLQSDDEVPEYIGEGIAALSTMRMKVVEKADAADFGGEGVYYGIIEINPAYSAEK